MECILFDYYSTLLQPVGRLCLSEEVFVEIQKIINTDSLYYKKTIIFYYYV